MRRRLIRIVERVVRRDPAEEELARLRQKMST
jgi:hypothetical protein